MEISLDLAEKVISAIAGFIAIAAAIFGVRRLRQGNAVHSSAHQAVTVNVGSAYGTAQPSVNVPSISELKRTANILFVDDDRGFKIVGILKKMGWEHTRLIADITSLEQIHLQEAQVVFVDIQGVGRAMQYADEGLGLALAIKRRYPSKKVVIYSAEENGKRFHEALQEADYSLPKTAEPIRFEDTIVRVLAA